MELDLVGIVLVSVIGLIGGCFGGLLGLGGSVFFIPALALLYGPNQHVYQAAALIVNVFVALTATIRHRGKGTIQSDLVWLVALSSAATALLGVWLSNLLEPRPLSAIFGSFLIYAAISEFTRLLRGGAGGVADPATPSRRRQAALVAGVAGGAASGLLGIGGGAVMVPILVRFVRLPIRAAVATTSAAMIITCVVGAVAKNLAVGGLPDAAGSAISATAPMVLASVLAPAAVLGAYLGASIVYAIPPTATRIVLALLLLGGGARMVSAGMSTATAVASGRTQAGLEQVEEASDQSGATQESE
ncbi:MAG: hypothetical protein RL136_2492 [Planctomycetota bacterium]|jgi:uncharacterized membrane protein YfcA